MCCNKSYLDRIQTYIILNLFTGDCAEVEEEKDDKRKRIKTNDKYRGIHQPNWTKMTTKLKSCV